MYFWADGIYANVRLEDEENSFQCLLVLMGATADGHKELIAVVDGYRESEQELVRGPGGAAATRLEAPAEAGGR